MRLHNAEEAGSDMLGTESWHHPHSVDVEGKLHLGLKYQRVKYIRAENRMSM